LKVALHLRELKAVEAGLRDAPQEPVHLDPAMLAELHDAYGEHEEYGYGPIVLRFPSCFRAATTDIDDLTVEPIEALFEKS